MVKPLSVSLDAVRTDGWFERIGEGIGSFQALCEILGERFFAFSLITGARITALSVDRRNIENTLVDFVVGGEDGDDFDVEPQRLTLADFRRRLVGALLADEVHASPPQRESDIEATQLHIGVRNLLLAPLYGYSLQRLSVDSSGQTMLDLLHDGIEEAYELDMFRERLRAHVREELERVSGGGRGIIDLARVAEAEQAAKNKNFSKVRQLLGAWPAPLAIFLRTPDGQLLGKEARSLIAKGLGLLGTACVELGDVDHGEEIFRLAVQYAQDGIAGADIFLRLGAALLKGERAGEAVAALRRAINLGAPEKEVWPLLAQAFLKRKRYVAAVSCVREAKKAGASESDTVETERELEKAMGAALTAFRAHVLAPSKTA
jgi:tetratricopeptide (TPR) repeat protein